MFIMVRMVFVLNDINKKIRKLFLMMINDLSLNIKLLSIKHWESTL